jgi:hypothetical protein
LRDEIRKESSNKKGVKTKQLAIKKNKDQFCHKIKWIRILRDATEKKI